MIVRSVSALSVTSVAAGDDTGAVARTVPETDAGRDLILGPEPCPTANRNDPAASLRDDWRTDVRKT